MLDRNFQPLPRNNSDLFLTKINGEPGFQDIDPKTIDLMNDVTAALFPNHDGSGKIRQQDDN